jgi:hypothetical protein
MNGRISKQIRRHAELKTVDRPYRRYQKTNIHPIRVTDPLAKGGYRLAYVTDPIRLDNDCTRAVIKSIKSYMKAI